MILPLMTYAPAPVPRALWVWHAGDLVESPAGRKELFAFLEAAAISVVRMPVGTAIIP